MKRKLIIFFSVIIIVALLIGGITLACFAGIDYLDEKSKLSELELYTLQENEMTLKTFEDNNKKYSITRLNENNSTTINILLKEKNKTYLLDKVNKCDTTEKGENIYVDKNMIYIHCIGEEREVLEFELNKASIYKTSIHLNYSDTPNVSGTHLLIEKADKKYIYFYSYVKKDETVAEGEKIKCALSTNICKYN